MAIDALPVWASEANPLWDARMTFPEGSAQGVWPPQFPGRAGPDVPEIVSGPPEPPPSPWSTAQRWTEFQDGVMAVELVMSA